MYEQSSEPPELTRYPWSKSERFVPRTVVRPLQRFSETEAAGAIVMLVAAIAALVWANSPWWQAQATLWGTHLNIELGHLAHIDLDVVGWINDALMALFFFLVGLEIKRELVHGELRDPRKAALPVIAAFGGMAVPALVFMLFNAGADSSKGWGIPMATDIAFAVAVVALVGPRIPSAAKLFLLTLAIADDIGAIVVIAVFYTSDLSIGWLAIALATIVALVAVKRLDVRAMPVYYALGAFLWFCVHESGVHATLAGVTLGLLTPAWPFLDPRRFGERAAHHIRRADPVAPGDPMTQEQFDLNQHELGELQRLVAETQSPLDRIAHRLEPWVAFVIVPLFAFSNAGVRLTSEALDGIATDKVVLGVGLGLLLGKTVGVLAATWVGATLRIGTLPSGLTYRHVLGLAVTAGIGFTVALFVAGLSFDAGSPFTDSAKIGILGGSLLSGILGYTLLRTAPPVAGFDAGEEGAVPAV